jgi:hypothetical protein
MSKCSRTGLDNTKAIAMGRAFEAKLHEHWRKETQDEAAAPPPKPGDPYWAEEDFDLDTDWGKDDHIQPKTRPPSED